MKRIAALFLLILYFLTSTGAMLHHHYCMGEIANSSFWANKEKQCGKCGMEKHESQANGCCRDEMQWIKVDDDQKASVAHFEISKFQLEAIGFIFLNGNIFASKERDAFTESKAPLRSGELRTYILNRVFRI